MKTLEIAAQAMQADLQRLAHISQNLANVQTPGYKRTVSVQRPFALQMEAEQAQAAALQIDGTVDHAAGSLRATGNPMDLALEGDGFFVVQTAQGRALTRQATLQLDAQGRLSTAAGLPVQGERGELQVGSAAKAWHVDAHGEVWADGRSVGRLLVLRVNDRALLQPLGGGLYRGEDAGQAVDAPRVMAGYQEASNVSSSSEMVHLMETGRHFEALARTVQGYDEALEKAIRKLGEL